MADVARAQREFLVEVRDVVHDLPASEPATREAAIGGAAELEPGEVFAGRYEVRRLLGEGGRKRTYLARDRKMNRLVAVSLVKPGGVRADPEGTVREAQVLGRIGEHDNIVSLYDYEIDVDRSVQYMVFEYLRGGTLTDHLQESGQRSLDEILRFGRQLCRGLSHLHKSGLIHRDVSPDNVWLDDRHVAHLGDFDSAITSADASAGGLRPITTGPFTAPEEREGRSLDVRSDLFSLGGVLYFVAAGTRSGDAGLLRSRRPDLPSSFGNLVASLLSDSPDDRPQDAESVLQQLDEIRSTSNVDALIAAGESDNIEFKSSLHHLYGTLPPEQLARPELGKVQPKPGQKELRKAIQIAVTKTIAAFLNTSGGTLLIGVDDLGTVLGIEPDFEYLQRGKQNADRWLSSLKDVIINALGPDVWTAINVSLVPHNQKTVAVVRCPCRTIPTWHGKDGGERFYIRAPNATAELTGSSLVSYIHEHWPA